MTTDILQKLVEQGFLQFDERYENAKAIYEEWTGKLSEKEAAREARVSEETEEEEEEEEEEIPIDLDYQLKSNKELGLDWWRTPHECRWTDIEGNECYFGELHGLDFGYGKLPEVKFEHKELVERIAKEVGAEPVYLFAPYDCNCCS